MELGPMGPIGEEESLILRVNRNCPWNRCLFCTSYKGMEFSRRALKDIKGDIDTIRRIAELIERKSVEMGYAGNVTKFVLQHVIMDNSDIFGKPSSGMNKQAMASLSNVARWLSYGGKKVFLQDANALAVKPGKLIEVLQYLKLNFKGIETITCYARSKTCFIRTENELRELKDAGLSRCLVGIESGYDKVLDKMKKGVTRVEHLDGGKKMRAAGINVAAFIMPGMAGADTAMSEIHTRETISLLNEIQPAEIRIRSIAVLEHSPLYECYCKGLFTPATEDQMVKEIRMLLDGLNFDCIVETYQMTNLLFNIRDNLKDKKNELISLIDKYLNLSPLDRARFRLNRYLSGGYVNYLKAVRKYSATVAGLIDDAQKAIRRGSQDATEKVDRAIFAIKSKGVP